MLACVDGSLSHLDLAWRPDACVTVVAASDGYPGSYSTGLSIEGLEEAGKLDDVVVFHAGTRRSPEGRVLTSGGRVLNVSGVGPTVADARQRAYEGLSRISFEGMWNRTDIAAAID
jgi:phosphoribosylamine--glycine ligase